MCGIMCGIMVSANERRRKRYDGFDRGCIRRLDQGGGKRGAKMNDQLRTEIEQLSADYAACAKMLTAIGDETRQHLILEMMKMGDCSGVRVGEITEKTNLSRPAVSHHLQIMKDAGIVKVRREGTKNYYYFDPEMSALERLAEALRLTILVMVRLRQPCGVVRLFRQLVCERMRLYRHRCHSKVRRMCQRCELVQGEKSMGGQLYRADARNDHLLRLE